MHGKQLRKFGENLRQKGDAGFTETRYCLLFIFGTMIIPQAVRQNENKERTIFKTLFLGESFARIGLFDGFVLRFLEKYATLKWDKALIR